jgi:Cache 3/Cache 2 fusion domain
MAPQWPKFTLSALITVLALILLNTPPQEIALMVFNRTLLCATLALASGGALANDPKATIDMLDARLGKLGAPRLEGTAKVADKDVPAIFFGTRRINGNYDIVDEIKKSSGATATVFVKEGEEFTRVSTNVLTPEGKRGVGTQLARNAAYSSVIKGQAFCGTVDVLGKMYDTCYHPIKDVAGAVIGATYIGYKK